MSGCVSINPCAAGIPGGSPGSKWFSGIGTPNPVLGVSNDLYLNKSNGDVYQKISGIWEFQLNILGTPGSEDSSYLVEALIPISIGQAVYVTNTAKLDLAYSNSLPFSQVSGFSIEAVLSGFACKYKSEGKIKLLDWTVVSGTASLSVGAEYFLSENSPGMINTVIPGSGYIISVGRAIKADTLDIEISTPIQL